MRINDRGASRPASSSVFGVGWAYLQEMSRPCLTLVTQQRWRADDFAQIADVRLDTGLDTGAAADPEAVLWCSGAWAAAAASRNPDLRLSSAGPGWLMGWSDRIKGRYVSRHTAGGLLAEHERSVRTRWRDCVFAKLPETKHELFEAKIRTPGALARDLRPLPTDEPVQLQGPVTFEHEVRCWVLDGQVVAWSAYFPDTPRERWTELEEPERTADAVAWLTERIARGPAVPPAVVIDVGHCTDPFYGEPGWRIVEANAPWSADWYAAQDMTAVIATITASQRGVSDPWRWHPSPLLVHLSAGLARR